MLKDWSRGEEDGKSRGQDGQKGPGREATGRGWTWMEGGGGGGGAGGGAGAGAGAGEEEKWGGRRGLFRDYLKGHGAMGSGILFLVFCLLHFGVHVHVCCLAARARENENVRGSARGSEEGRGTRIDV
jgi:hypothetical protein